MRDMLFSPSIFTPPKISDADSKSAIDTKSVREVLIPVFLSEEEREGRQGTISSFENS
jgi:hypothetical protein